MSYIISNQFNEQGIPQLLDTILPHCISSDQSEKSAQASSSKSQVLARGVSQEFELQMLQYQLPCHAHLPVTMFTDAQYMEHKMIKTRNGITRENVKFKG